MKRIKKMFFVLLTVVIVIVLGFLYLGRPAKPIAQQFGVSYSAKQAKALQLDPRETYTALLEEVGVKRIRLAAYWDELEPIKGRLDFAELDWEMDEAARYDAKVVLAVGRKLPRWPECFYPEWLQGASLEMENAILLDRLEQIVNRYDDHPALYHWQLENEPFVSWFGHCPKPNPALLKKELALIKKISIRPVMITDSGELSSWRRAANFADLFGTTLYRRTWNPYLGYGTYPLPPGIYRAKARLWGLDPNEAVIAELQMEPWPPGTDIIDTSVEEQFKSMNAQFFDEQIAFAKATGFKETYLWGAEWWYWMKLKQSHPEFWNKAKQLFVTS